MRANMAVLPLLARRSVAPDRERVEGARASYYFPPRALTLLSAASSVIATMQDMSLADASFLCSQFHFCTSRQVAMSHQRACLATDAIHSVTGQKQPLSSPPQGPQGPDSPICVHQG